MQPETMADFGTYHHSSREESDVIRKHVQRLFVEAFSSTGISRGSNLDILDIGSGLGSLASIAAGFFQKARITCIDNFRDSSLKGSSMEKGRRNMDILGLRQQVSFVEKDIMDLDDTFGKFDLAISNLVLHNLGRRRFEAYERIAWVLKEGALFINGDLFLQHGSGDPFNSDMKKVSKIYRVTDHFSEPDSGEWKAYHIVVLKLRHYSIISSPSRVPERDILP